MSKNARNQRESFRNRRNPPPPMSVDPKDDWTQADKDAEAWEDYDPGDYYEDYPSTHDDGCLDCGSPWHKQGSYHCYEVHKDDCDE